MNLVVWLLVGGIMGCMASMLLQAPPRRGMSASILVGVGGAILGGWVISPLVFGVATDQVAFSAAGMLVSLGSAIALLALMNLLRREVAR